MDITNVASSSTTDTAAIAADKKLSDDFDNFLTLLTTQLKHQDPLEPMDSNQFTEQLVQFTQVEQSIATNKNLEQLLSSYQAGQAAASISYLGKTVVAEGIQNQLVNGEATWRYEIAGATDRVGIVVTNDTGKVVFVGSGDANAGTNEFTWNGKDNAGNQLPDGPYNLSVTAQDPSGGNLKVTTYVVGTVDGIRNDAAGPVLLIGDAEVGFADIVRIEDRQQKATDNEENSSSNLADGQA